MRCCRAENLSLFLLTPLREGRPEEAAHEATQVYNISTHAPAGGATHRRNYRLLNSEVHFYSRPCGRGDESSFSSSSTIRSFLLTPLREGRLGFEDKGLHLRLISTHAPAGGATSTSAPATSARAGISTHAPAGGATSALFCSRQIPFYFYSRPCGRGDRCVTRRSAANSLFLLTPLREGRRSAA